jgi:cytochrome c oxidase cbb3-type subunit 4
MTYEAIFAALRSLWTLWFMALFVGIVVWTFWPRRKCQFEEPSTIPLRDDQ